MKTKNRYKNNKGLIEKYLRKLKIGQRFFVLFLFFSFIPMMFIGTVTYNKAQATIEEKVSKYCMQINTGIKTNYDLLFKSIDEFSIEVMYKKELQDELAQLIVEKSIPNEQDYFLKNDIIQYLKGNVLLNKNQILNINIVTNDKTSITYDINFNEFGKSSTHQIITNDLYKLAVEANGKLVWNTVAKGNSAKVYGYENMDNTFQVTRAFGLPHRQGSIVGVTSILYSSSFLEPTYKDITGEGDVYLIDSNNMVLFSNKKEFIYKKFPYEKVIAGKREAFRNLDEVYYKKLTDKNILLTYSISKVNGWGVVYVAPYSQLVKENKQFGIFILMVAIILLLIASISTFIFSTSISNPLKRLIKVTKKVKSGDFEVRDNASGNDEITDLTLSFNDMIGKVDELIKEVYETKIREKDFKLRALQSQINPHFLYNTLDSIRWVARKNKDYDVSKRIENLSSMFRLILSDDSIITTLDQEIKYTEYYLFFQIQSFKEKLKIIWDIDDSVREFKTIKLLLQPIVENSIIHGMDTSKEQLIIKIVIRDRNENIYIKIEDNGIGADEVYVKETLESKPLCKSGIGLKNVNDRIKEYYGENYMLHFSSKVGERTVVEITVPKKN